VERRSESALTINWLRRATIFGSPLKEEVVMFSPLKLIILIAVIAIVWYGFKAMGRMKAKAAKLNESDDQDNIEGRN
jgi:flagellar biogenesis protein FliO